MRNQLLTSIMRTSVICLWVAGCATSNGGTDLGKDIGSDVPADTATIDVPEIETHSIALCVKGLGWQSDRVVAAELNGIPAPGGETCTGGSTVEWYQENVTTTTFDRIMAWDYVGAGTCLSRNPVPMEDATLCRFSGTHTWDVIPGVDPTTRMILTEAITTVNGDFAGAGIDDKCGPASVLEGTSVRYVVQMDGECDSGTRVWMWEPTDSDTEPFPGGAGIDTDGTAMPMVLCEEPGVIGPDDHVPGRRICPAAISVTE